MQNNSEKDTHKKRKLEDNYASGMPTPKSADGRGPGARTRPPRRAASTPTVVHNEYYHLLGIEVTADSTEIKKASVL